MKTDICFKIIWCYFLNACLGSKYLNFYPALIAYHHFIRFNVLIFKSFEHQCLNIRDTKAYRAMSSRQYK